MRDLIGRQRRRKQPASSASLKVLSASDVIVTGSVETLLLVSVKLYTTLAPPSAMVAGPSLVTVITGATLVAAMLWSSVSETGVSSSS